MKEASSSAIDFVALRTAEADEVGRALVRFSPWLALLAKVQIESRYFSKFDPADIVQQTMLEACRSIGDFRGSSEAEFAGWLRGILAHVIANEFRHYGQTNKRDLGREQSIEAELAQSSARLASVLAASESSPSDRAMRAEQELLLAEVLESLPADYREVIVLRNLEGLAHEEAAARMGRSSGAVRMLWVRALASLREALLARGVERP